MGMADEPVPPPPSDQEQPEQEQITGHVRLLLVFTKDHKIKLAASDVALPENAQPQVAFNGLCALLDAGESLANALAQAIASVVNQHPNKVKADAMAAVTERRRRQQAKQIVVAADMPSPAASLVDQNGHGGRLRLAGN